LIGDRAFSDCYGLTLLTFPSAITSIGKFTFDYCIGLTSITLPSTVTSIGEGAFINCTGLTEIHCQMETPPVINISDYVFNSVDKNTCKLYVPMGTSGLYSEAAVWSDFTTIIEEEVTAVKATKTTQATVYTEQQEIVVKGAGLGETIFVYTTSGVLVKTIKATNNVRIPVPSDQIYLVRIADKTFKVAL